MVGDSIELSDEHTDCAAQSAEVLGLDVSWVDMLKSNAGPWVQRGQLFTGFSVVGEGGRDGYRTIHPHLCR